MKPLDHSEALRQVARGARKPAAYISINTDLDAVGGDYARWRNETLKAAPWLEGHELSSQVLIDREGFVIFSSDAEMQSVFAQTKGDDPNLVNTYRGPGNVYMLTCAADGRLLNENT